MGPFQLEFRTATTLFKRVEVQSCHFPIIPFRIVLLYWGLPTPQPIRAASYSGSRCSQKLWATPGTRLCHLCASPNEGRKEHVVHKPGFFPCRPYLRTARYINPATGSTILLLDQHPPSSSDSDTRTKPPKTWNRTKRSSTATES